jgi:LmbE family N-acetylglucosaminyl deacetylase
VALSVVETAPSSTPVQAKGVPSFSARTRLLVVAPHPDDETIATGLLIQQVRAAGGEVHILLLTAGDNNPWPQRWLERRVRIRGADRQRWGKRRLAEMLQALQHLGVPASALQPLGWQDLGLADEVLRADRTAVSALRVAISQFRPDLVVAPALSDRHPDHGSAHVLVRLALAGQVDPPRLLTYLVHGDACRDSAVEIHGTPTQVENKRMALEAHRSQMALSGKRMHRLAARPECHVDVVALPAAGGATGLPWQPPFWLRPWLRLSVTGPAGTHHWRWHEAPLRRDRGGVFRLSLAHADPGHPCFARLELTLRSPWIFDRWGWCELSGSTGHRGAGLAQDDLPD